MLEEHFKDQMDEVIRLSPKGRQTMLFSATMTDEVSYAFSYASQKMPFLSFLEHDGLLFV